MTRWLAQLSWPELRHHPWRNAAALIAVMLGVALAFSVQLINQSALSEFSSAVRSVNGEPDFELRGQRAGFDEAFYGRVAQHPAVAIASPVIEIDTLAFDSQGERVPLKVIGLDALVAAPLAPALMPRPDAGSDRMALLDASAIFRNAEAHKRLVAAKSQPLAAAPPSSAPAASAALSSPLRVRLQTPSGATMLSVQGSVTVGGPPLAVMDIAGAQTTFGWLGRISRIDVRLRPGADRAQVLRELALPAGVRAAAPIEATQRVSIVSRAYRVNLTVLALVALFTGAFLVFSILSLSVAQRAPQLALLGVLGLAGRVGAARRGGQRARHRARHGAGRARVAAVVGRPGRRLLSGRGTAPAVQRGGRAGVRRARRGGGRDRRLAARTRCAAHGAGTGLEGPGSGRRAPGRAVVRAGAHRARRGLVVAATGVRDFRSRRMRAWPACCSAASPACPAQCHGCSGALPHRTTHWRCWSWSAPATSAAPPPSRWPAWWRA